MKCPQCDVDNRDEARFCRQCGETFGVTCSRCGANGAGGSTFCDRCGAPLTLAQPTAPQRFASPERYTPKYLADKILISRAALEGERKQITVLFADLKGSMESIANRDPEEAERLVLDPVLERMIEAVHRYEGFVNQVMGDGIMALFGAPLAHEDHAVRACYAALRMQEAVKHYAEEARRLHGVSVQIRVGLNSGEVFVRAIGGDLRMEYRAIGQTTHLAARMEQLADPGSILLTPPTLALVEGYFAVKSLGPVPVRGLAEALEVHELTAAGPARTRLQATARRGLTRFVGRDEELDQLHRLMRVAATGRGQVAAVVGDAGVGKSRLVYELTHSPRLQDWLILEGAAVSYGKATSYLPVIHLLKGYFKIRDRDDLRDIREKVTGKLLTLDETLKPTLPAILALLDVPVEDVAWQTSDPVQRRQRTLDAVKRVLVREARRQHLLLVFEDLHWIDGETQALLNALVESLGSVSAAMLVNYRPEYTHAWGSRMVYTQIRLDALPAEGAGELLNVLLGEDPGLGELKRLLVTHGNPFFLEEVVRTLVETKTLTGERGRYRLTQSIQRIHIPATVQTMLAARIDRLPPEEKRLLQTASVIGNDAPLALLRAIAELSDETLRGGLDHLQSAELLYETGLYPDLEYAFTHALTHDVTYDGLPRERRRTLHARIVEAIERLHKDRLGEHTERLAHHALRGELREKAVHYLRQAGGKAAARCALQDAQRWFSEALTVLETLPDDRATLEQAFEIRLDLRPVLNLLGEARGALDRLREAEALAARLNDDRRRGRVCAFMTVTHALLGELDDALATGDRALTIARDLDDLDLSILTRTYLEQAHYFRGAYERVVELATENIAALPTDRVPASLGNTVPAWVYDRVWLITSLAELGKFSEAAKYEAEAVRLADRTEHAFTVGMAHFAAGVLGILKGDWAKARSEIEHWIVVARTGNVVLMLPFAISLSAWVLAQMLETREALSRLGEGVGLLERHGATGIGNLGSVHYALGRACLLLGQLDEAQRLGERAVESSAAQPGFAAHALLLLGDIAIHPGRFDPERGAAFYRNALALAQPRGMRPVIAHCHLGMGRLYRRTDKHQQALDSFAVAREVYRELGMLFWLVQAEREQEELA